MVYEKQTWAYKDEITAEKLNHIEDGIASASSGGGGTPLIVNATVRDATEEECGTNGGTTITFSHSWQEMYDAFIAGRAVILDTTELPGAASGQSFSAVTEFFADDMGAYIFYLNAARVVSMTFGSPTSKTVVICSVD